MSLTKKILMGLGLGIIVGLILNLALPGIFEPVSKFVFVPLGKIFVNLIKMLVVPIVIVSLILGTAGISDPKKLGRIGGILSYYYSNCHYYSFRNGNGISAWCR